MHIVYRPNITDMATNFQSSFGLVKGSLATISDEDNDGLFDTAKFSFGTLVNNPDGVSQGVNDTIVVEVAAVLADSNYNYANYNPRYVFTFSHQSDIARSHPRNFNLKTVEPSYVLSSTVGSFIPYGSTSLTEAGVVATYTARIYASGSTGPGYNFVFTDTLSTYLALLPGTVTVSGCQGTEIVTGNGANDNTVTVTVFTCPKGAEFTVTYKARFVDTTYTYSTVRNAARCTYKSAPLDGLYNPGFIRTYTPLTDNAPVTTQQVSYDGDRSETSIPETATYHVLIGEVVKYTSTIVFPAGLTANTVLTFYVDSAEPVLSILDGSVTIMHPNVNSTTAVLGTKFTPTDSNGDGYNENLRINLGNVLNLFNGDYATPVDKVTVSVDFLVVNSNYQRRNSFIYAYNYLQYSNGATTFTTNTQPTGLYTYIATIYIVKTATQISYIEAGSTITYTVQVTNTNEVPVYDSYIVDNLSSSFALVTGSVTMSSSAGAVVLGNSGTDPTIKVNLPSPFSSGTVTITYKATLTNSIVVNSTISNTAYFTYSSAPTTAVNRGNVQTLTSGSTERITTAYPTLTNTYLSTSFPQSVSGRVVVGSTVTFQVNVTLPQGTSRDSVLTVQLPYNAGKLRGVIGTITKLPSNIVSQNVGLDEQLSVVPTDNFAGDDVPDTFTFVLGNLINYPDGARNQRDTITVEVVALVLDDTRNRNGQQAQTVATFTTSTSTFTQTAFCTIYVPALEIRKVATTPSYLVAGSIVQYAVTVTNPSSVIAYNVSVWDLLSKELALVVGTLNTSRGSVMTGSNQADSTILIAVETIPVGGSVTILYQCRVTVEANTASQIPNTAYIKYGSALYDNQNRGNVRFIDSNTTAYVWVSEPMYSIGYTSSSNVETPDTFLSIGEAIYMKYVFLSSFLVSYSLLNLLLILSMQC